MTPLQTLESAAATGPTDARWYGAASLHVARFLRQLRCMPPAMWLSAAESAPLAGDEAGLLADRPSVALLEEQADVAARRRLYEALESMPAVVRRIRNRVNNDLTIFEDIVSIAAMQRMRRVATLAAFAIAAHPKLSRDDVRRLYRPFADVIPLPRELLSA